MTKSSTINNQAISRWRAEFTDLQLENAYQQHVLPDTVRFLRFSLYLWAGLLIAAIPMDFGAMTSPEGIMVISGLRIGHVILLLWLAWQLKRTPAWASNGWPVSIVAMLGYPLFLVYPVYEPSLGDVSRGALFLMMLSIYVFIPNRLMLTNLVAVVGIVGATAIQIWMGADSAEVMFTFVALCWPALLGGVVAHRSLVGSRRAYLLLRAAESANELLETEIEARHALEAELQRQALTDPLTGLSNRRHYEMLFKREHDRCRRHQAALSLGMIDLDHFKRVNDTCGHEFGDQVLQFAAEILQRPLRHSDILGRFGGEEFILILPDTDIVHARLVAERMREALEQESMSRNGITLTVTATFAMTQVRAEDADIQECIRRADHALYEAKRAGRNRVAISGPAGDLRHTS